MRWGMKWAVMGLLVALVAPMALGNSSVQFGHWDGATWIQAHDFRIGERLAPADRVWVRVLDPDIVAAQQYWVTLHNPGTGDSVQHRLATLAGVGTANATATSDAPIALVPATGTPSLADNRLEVRPGDTIYVYYTDPLDAADQSDNDAVAVLGKVHLYEGAPQPGYRNLVATFDDPNPITTAIGRAAAVVAEGLARMYRPWIVVTSGDYREDVDVDLSDIVIESQARHGATLYNAGVNAPVRISADNVTLRGFVIELDMGVPGVSPAGASGIFAGAARSGIRIEHNLIRKIHGTTDRYAMNFANNLTASAIVGNTIEGTFGTTRTAEGIRIDGARVTNVLIEGNTIRECRDHGVHFSNAGGIAEDLRILGNEIVNCDANLSGVGSGVHFNAGFTVRAVRIAGNTFQQNEHGVNLQLAAGNSVRDLLIEGNTFLNHRRTVDGNQLEGALQSGLRVIAAGILTPVNFQVRNNDFAGNEAGILLTCADPVNAANQNVRGVQIAGNVIAGNDIGIWLRHQNNTIMGNDIADNVLWGVHASSIGGDPRNMVNARENWWGHPYGPYHTTKNPDGRGNAVTNHVDFQPFLGGSGADPVLEFADVEMMPDGTGTVELKFNASGLAWLDIHPQSWIEISDSDKVNVTGVVGHGPYQIEDGSLVVDDPNTAGQPIEIQFLLFLLPGAEPQEGTIVRINLEGTGAGAEGDTLTVEIRGTVDRCVDRDGKTIPHYSVRTGTITLDEDAFIKGDVNFDRVVDITDARWVAEYVIGTREFTAAQEQAADVAPPVGVDITDARWIAQYAVSGTWPSSTTLAVPMTYGVHAAYALQGGVLEFSGAQAADVQGRILYDPADVSITGLSGLSGFQVFWRDDPASGEVRFAAYRLHSGVAGPVVQVHGQGDLSALSVELDLLRAADGSDIPFEATHTGGTALTVLSTPNPATGVTHFYAQASAPVAEIRVALFDLAGRPVWDSGWVANGAAWHLDDPQGRPVASGIYLYRIDVKLEGLDTTVTSALQKLVVIR